MASIISQNFPVPTASPGFADVVGFGQDGVIILRNAFNEKPIKVVNNFGINAGGWQTGKHVRLVANVTGEGRADLIGFGENGVWVSVNIGKNKFSDPRFVLADFSYSSGGWRVEKHIRFLVDIRNIGRCDIIGFGDNGVYVSRNNGNLNFGPATLLLPDFGYINGGWRIGRHLRFLADVTGDARPDIVGFGEDNVFISRNTGTGFTPAQAVLDNFCIGAGGWQIDSHPRFLADLTGDGRTDIIGCGDAGVYVSLNNGGGSFGPVNLVLDNFGTEQEWRVSKHPRFVADLTGDSRGDIIGFGEDGVWTSLNQGNGKFGPAKQVLNNFCVAQGWQVDKHPRFVVDLTGDGCADIIGFGEAAVLVSFNSGKGGYGPVQEITREFAFNRGQWSLDKTVRFEANLGRP